MCIRDSHETIHSELQGWGYRRKRFRRGDVYKRQVRVSQRNLRGEIIETQRLEYRENNIDHFLELLFQLIGRTEQMGIILREPAHPCQDVYKRQAFVYISLAWVLFPSFW